MKDDMGVYLKTILGGGVPSSGQAQTCLSLIRSYFAFIDPHGFDLPICFMTSSWSQFQDHQDRQVGLIIKKKKCMSTFFGQKICFKKQGFRV